MLALEALPPAGSVGERVERIGVDDRALRSALTRFRVRRSVAGWRPSPGPITTASYAAASLVTRRQPLGAMRPGASSSSTIQVSSGTMPPRRAATDCGRGDRHEPGAGAHGAEPGQQRGAGVLDRAGDDEEAAEVALVGPLGARRQALGDPALR